MATEPFYLGSNLRYLRELDELTKHQLSKIVHSSSSELGYIERNEVPKPSYQIVEALADYFGVDMRDLVRSDLTGIGHTIDRDIKRILRCANGVEAIHHEDALRYTLFGFLRTLTEKEHFSIRRRSILFERRMSLKSVPKK